MIEDKKETNESQDLEKIRSKSKQKSSNKLKNNKETAELLISNN